MKAAADYSWYRALAALPEKEVHAVAGEVLNGMRILHRQLPKAGLGLLRIRDGALGESFFLGEYPLATAHIELQTTNGGSYAGGAVIMADDPALAVSLAICDAIYRHRLTGWEKVARLVAEGMAHCRQTQAVRNAMLSRTRVDFSLLATTEEEAECDGDT
jgi:alpha-D-ribose 1-methylphosphonate 5-triphosphate synthase subunit PhnG